jgi:hypothetical protein
VVRNGYVSQQRLASGQRTFSVRAGDAVSDLKVMLTPQAVITGRVLDAEGEPIQSVQVLAFRREMSSGAMRWTTVENGSTNDAGEYRLSGLPVGRYTVCAAESQRDRVARAGRRVYVATCHPNIGEVQQSPAIDVSPGNVTSGIDIRLLASESR